MIEQMTADSPVLSTVGKKHFWLFRAGVTVDDQILDYAVLRTAWRRDRYNEGLPETFLAKCLRQDPESERWKASVLRLWNYFAITVVDIDPECRHQLESSVANPSSRRIQVTTRGRDWAATLCAERQRAGKSPDGIEE